MISLTLAVEIAALLVVIVGSFDVGRRSGERRERARVGRLCYAACNRGRSRTLNWVWESVREGREELPAFEDWNDGRLS